MKPILIPGDAHQDERGSLTFNNFLNLYGVKRIYTIENKDLNFIRGWQGHKIEKRWLIAMKGVFEIEILDILFFEKEKEKNEIKSLKFILNSNKMDVLHIPPGYVTSIKAIEADSKLLLMSDYMLGEVQDEIRISL